MISYLLARGTVTGARHNGGAPSFWRYGILTLANLLPYASVCQVRPLFSPVRSFYRPNTKVGFDVRLGFSDTFYKVRPLSHITMPSRELSDRNCASGILKTRRLVRRHHCGIVKLKPEVSDPTLMYHHSLTFPLRIKTGSILQAAGSMGDPGCRVREQCYLRPCRSI